LKIKKGIDEIQKKLLNHERKVEIKYDEKKFPKISKKVSLAGLQKNQMRLFE